MPICMNMMISEEQAKAAAVYIKAQRPCAPIEGTDVPAAVVDRAREAAESAPDVRPERVDDAVRRMRAHSVDSHEIAEKMISRIISDALR